MRSLLEVPVWVETDAAQLSKCGFLAVIPQFINHFKKLNVCGLEQETSALILVHRRNPPRVPLLFS